MKFSLVLSFLCFTMFGLAQGELDNFDCNYSKPVTIPFQFSGPEALPSLNQVLFYSYRDQFTYWYRITIQEDALLTFKVSAINDSDSYYVVLYQYNQPDFCQKVYAQKIKPVAPSYYIGTGAEKEASKAPLKTIHAKKGQVYYISILNTSLNYCGHDFSLTYGKDTLRVKALHLPCKRDLSKITTVSPLVQKPVKLTDSVVHQSTQVPITKDPPKPVAEIQLTPLQNTLLCQVKDHKTNLAIDSKLTITDSDNQDAVPLQALEKGQWRVVLEAGKTYRLKGSAFGYRDTVQWIHLGNEKEQNVFLEPLKVGDNFIMKSIYFHPNTYALRKESTGELESLLGYLLNHPTVSIEIQGHTNGDHKIYKNKLYENLGEEWNFQGSAKKLSLKRAEAITNYLVSNGVDRLRLLPEGYGGSRYIVKEPETMEEGQKNIRVEIVILKD